MDNTAVVLTSTGQLVCCCLQYFFLGMPGFLLEMEERNGFVLLLSWESFSFVLFYFSSPPAHGCCWAWFVIQVCKNDRHLMHCTAVLCSPVLVTLCTAVFSQYMLIHYKLTFSVFLSCDGWFSPSDGRKTCDFHFFTLSSIYWFPQQERIAGIHNNSFFHCCSSKQHAKTHVVPVGYRELDWPLLTTYC